MLLLLPLLLFFNLLNLSKGRRVQVKYKQRELLAACGQGKLGAQRCWGWGRSVGWKMGASAVPKKNIIKSNQSEDADTATAHESKIN